LKTGFAICLYFSSKLLKYNQISKKKTKKKEAAFTFETAPFCFKNS